MRRTTRTAMTVLIGAMLVGELGCIAAARRAGREIGRQRAGREAQARALDVDPVAWTARPGHPRLMADDAAWTAAKGDDAFRRDWVDKLRARADVWIAAGDPIAYDGKKLLGRSREALQRLPTYAGLWRVTGEQKYADAGRRELLNVCDFPDWTPANTLALAEMANAVAVGYDWLFDALSEKERRVVVKAIVDKALKPAVDAYASGGGWTTAPHNWNLVCNGGLIVASLAVLEEEPDAARRVLGLAMKSVENGLKTLDDAHGGWPEGPMYHNYAMRYAVFAAAAMESAVQPPQRLPSPFIGDAGRFRIQMEGPTGKSFNFGDADELVGNSAWLMWLGPRFNSAYVPFQANASSAEPTIFDLLWYTDAGKPPAWPLAEQFPGAEVAVLRSGFEKTSTYLAIKGGTNASNHTHLDLGTFVLDMAGERWASELGADNYDLPGYLGPRRSQYLRSSTPGQNTLTIGNESQPGEALAVIARFDAEKKTAVVDLSPAYPAARSVTRTARVERDAALIRDEIRLARPAPVTWHLHTPAEAEQVGDRVVLRQNGKRVEMVVRSPQDVVVELSDDETRPPELPVKGMTHVRLRAKAATNIVFDVEFRPVQDD